MKAGMQPDDFKSELKPASLTSNLVHVEGTLIMRRAKNSYVTVTEDDLYLNDFPSDKHEESIVWKGGLVSQNFEGQRDFCSMEGHGLDDFYESDSQREEAIMHGTERIDWWASTWPNATGVREDCVLDSASSSISSSSLGDTDSELHVEAGSLLSSDTRLSRSIQQKVYQRRHVETDISSTRSTRASKLTKKNCSSRGSVIDLKELHKGCKTLMELDLPLSQDRLEGTPSTALDANMSEGGRSISGSSDRHLLPTIGCTNEDDEDKLSLCDSGSMKRECIMQEKILESSRYAIDTEDLDKLISEAKCRKENMKKDMEDIYLLRQRAEQEELVAQQAKVAATHGASDILSKVEDLRQQLLRRRAEYDMHAAEVYGERSVLAMEARELRLRLLETQADQTRALSMLDSVHSTLAARLEKASQEKEAALMEAQLKEECANELLAQEEDSARTLAENMKALEAEAKTCRKLREFLIERGNVVDSLQGEMAVLCEDVLNFKKQVDEGIPLTGNRSMSWSHMSHLTEQFASMSPLSDVKDGHSPRTLTLENSDFCKLQSETSVLTLSSTTSALQTNVGPIECALQSQYFSLNISPSHTLGVVNEKGLGGQEVAEEIVDRLISPASLSCDDGQKQESLEENLVSKPLPLV